MELRRLSFVGAVVIVVAVVLTAMAQTQSPLEKKRLTVVCYWQNFAEVIFSRLPSKLGAPYIATGGCEKYRDPTHCKRTAPDMLGDTKHDWERVTANGLIYTIRCKRNCKKIPAPSQSYDAETDGKLMWITFEMPDNRNVVEIFEIFDISPAKEDVATTTPS